MPLEGEIFLSNKMFLRHLVLVVVYEYQYGDNRVYFIIQRSRCLVGSSLQYIHDLVQYFKSCSIAGIISLSGASYEFLDINNQ